RFRTSAGRVLVAQIVGGSDRAHEDLPVFRLDLDRVELLRIRPMLAGSSRVVRESGIWRVDVGRALLTPAVVRVLRRGRRRCVALAVIGRLVLVGVGLRHARLAGSAGLVARRLLVVSALAGRRLVLGALLHIALSGLLLLTRLLCAAAVLTLLFSAFLRL